MNEQEEKESLKELKQLIAEERDVEVALARL